ncbi:helix-turn-helix domain-containing protein [Pseudoduganella aquatica]|uniref:Helix-turn-helix domain-containing protein n=1 Tax=Pseudoduganella aquatica TaxID=2660641 RepID=A0A7X4KKX3_9BURK|nr:XRE family transcriptional regulator [Pseudoduganella aquatica]MYN06567.1 helix-turn-helix domain-containing protein [Pseudoduganella aquatica]
MSQAKINERIRRARVSRGLSLEAVAGRMGDISKQALSKFESGQSAPNSARLLKLAKALEVKPEYFFRQESFALAPLEFRKLAKMPKYRQEQVREQMRDHLERYISLEDCFGGSLKIGVTSAQSILVTSVEEAEQAAEQLRQEWRVGGDAIANLVDLLENNGFKIVLLDGADDFDGACAATDDEQHVLISLNASRPGERMRFTAAHELGHWVMDLPSSMPEKTKERCCHRFAGAFLFPAAQVRAEFGDVQRSRVHPQELLNAKALYGVSMQVAIYRMKDLGLLSEAGYRALVITINANGWRKNEPEALEAERPRRFESLVYRGLAEEFFTLSRAAEFLQLPISALDAKGYGAQVLG